MTKLKRRKENQNLLPKVKWGSVEAANTWQSKYLGLIFEAGDSQLPDVRARIAMAQTTLFVHKNMSASLASGAGLIVSGFPNKY